MRERSVRLLAVAAMVITLVSALQLVSSYAEGQDLEIGTDSGHTTTSTSEPRKEPDSDDSTSDETATIDGSDDTRRCSVTTFAETDGNGTGRTYNTGSFDLRSSHAARARSIEVANCTATLCEFDASLGACTTFESGEHVLPDSLRDNVGYLSVTNPPRVDAGSELGDLTGPTPDAGIKDMPAETDPALVATETAVEPAEVAPADRAPAIPAPAPKEMPVSVSLPPTCEIQRAEARTVVIVMKHQPEGAVVRRVGFRDPIQSAGGAVVDTDVPIGRQGYEMVAGGQVVATCGTTTVSSPTIPPPQLRPTGSMTNPTECAVLLIGGHPLVSWRGAVNASSYRVWRNGEAITQVQTDRYTDRSATLSGHKYHYAVVAGENDDASRVYCGHIITS